jgi:hypothetical protein
MEQKGNTVSNFVACDVFIDVFDLKIQVKSIPKNKTTKYLMY